MFSFQPFVSPWSNNNNNNKFTHPPFQMTYVYTMFAAFTFAGLLFVVFFVPETKGKSPETMYQLFQQPWCCVDREGEYQTINTTTPSDEELS